MDNKPVIIGYGPKSAFSSMPVKDTSKQPFRGPTEMRTARQMVDVYNNDEFIERISLKTLVRFSNVAATAFPRPTTLTRTAEATAPAFPAHDQIVNQAVEEMVKLKTDSRDWADDVSNGSDKDQTLSTSLLRGAASLADTAPVRITEDHRSAPNPSQKPAPRPSLAHGEVEDAAHTVKKLFFSMDAYYIPSAEAMKQTLKRMKDNATVKPDGTLLPYGPAKAKEVDLNTLVDTYAAAVLFNLRPFPKMLRQELMNRITAQAPLQYEMFETMLNYLPVEDPVITRTVNQYNHACRTRQYAREQLDQFSVLLNDKDSAKFKVKVDENAAHHKRVAESRRRERAQQSTQEYWTRRGASTATTQQGATGNRITASKTDARGGLHRRNRHEQ